MCNYCYTECEGDICKTCRALGHHMIHDKIVAGGWCWLVKAHQGFHRHEDRHWYRMQDMVCGKCGQSLPDFIKLADGLNRLTS